MAATAQGAPHNVPWYRTKSGTEAIQKWSTFALLCFLAFLFVAPVIWMLITSLKSSQDVFNNQSWLPEFTSTGGSIPIPYPKYLSNYSDAMTQVPFRTYFQNTLIVTIFSIIGTILSSSLVAYSFARLRWPGRDFCFFLVLLTMLLPGIVTFIPQF